VSAIGLASWDRTLVVDHFPDLGSFAIVDRHLEAPGGTTGNIAVTLARLGARVRFLTSLGNDSQGKEVERRLRSEGVLLELIQSDHDLPTDESTILVADPTGERTILWRKGARPMLGDRIDIDALFGADLAVIDVDDDRLRRFLADLPVHTYPSTRLLGTLSYLEERLREEELAELFRFDYLVGNQREVSRITGANDLPSALELLQELMVGSNLRGFAITIGASGAIAITASERWQAPALDAPVVDTTGAGDAFAGAFAYAMALRWPMEESLRFATTVAGLSTSQLGAQTALPSFAEARARMDQTGP
jgi:sugar/nucleoside kinase (ribokinase family)